MKRRKTRRGACSPIRSALKEQSSLVPEVRDGLGALKKSDRAFIDGPLHACFKDSLDIDVALRRGHDNENRWDYLLGYEPTAAVFALEPHSAREDQISTVIAKRAATKRHLVCHLKPNARIEAWLWVASGKVHFANTEKARIRLDQNGILFVGTKMLHKHLS